jgi:amino acid permease
MSGTIIGVGMFGTPYAISQIGWPLALGFFLVLGAVQLFQHLFMAEAAAACDEQVRFTGLVERFLGRRYRRLATVTWACGFWASLVAYVLLGGQFLFTLFSPHFGGDVFLYQLGWAVVSSFIISRNLDFIGKLEVIGTVGLVAALGIILGVSLPHIEAVNYGTRVIDPMMAYGIILFSLSGVSAITEMEEEVAEDRKMFRWSVATGLLFSAALTLLFGFVVYGVTGATTTEDAVSGLQAAIGGVIPLAAAAFGFLAVATSFIGVGSDLKAMFQYDYHLRPSLAWLVTVSVPIGLMLIGARDFLSVVSFSAAVFGGAVAVMIAAMYIHVAKRKLMGDKALGVPVAIAYVTISVLLFGALAKVGSTIYGWVT